MLSAVKKIILWLALVEAILSILLTLSFWRDWQGNKLEVIFCDVGQGDAALIKTPAGQDILIDGGPGDAVLNCLGNHLSFYDRSLDLVILTHPHQDHLAGLVAVLDKYRVGSVIANNLDEVVSEASAKEFSQKIKEKKIKVVNAIAGQIIDLGRETRLEVLFPFNSQVNPKDLNDASIVGRLVYKNNEFLFTGDAGVGVEEAILQNKEKVTSDVLKAGHHGSFYSSSEIFLQTVAPQIAIISVGANNKFGHPSNLVVKRLERMGVEVFRTDQNGEIVLVGDGAKIYAKD